MDPTSRSTTGTEIDARDYSERDRLLDGRPVLLRAIRPEDKPHLREGFRRLSPESVYHRFFQAKQELSQAELRYLTEVDFESHVALLAILEEEGREIGVGVGRYIVEPGTRSAEVAFTVDETHHGLGVGTLLLKHLARIARARGLEEFRAYVLAENRAMLEVFENAGFPLERRLEGNVIVATLGLTYNPEP
jgi:RimJ/RimL family protein N-acetyltransferase